MSAVCTAPPPEGITPAQAARELLTRRKARRSLHEYVRYMMGSEYVPGAHLNRIMDALERVERGELKRLMLFMPPRHGKSMLASQLAPCWMLGRNPRMQIIQSGYASDIALEQSRKARDFFVDEKMRVLFPNVYHAPQRAGQLVVPVERQAAHEWGTKQKGRYYATGVGGGITGRGADLFIIDDPVKDRAEAESLTTRKKVWDWYVSTARNRLQPGAAIILIMTRWHTDDLAGRLLKQMKEGKGEQWEVISLPAINEAGEALWPEFWSLKELRVTEKVSGLYEWNSLFQQNPMVKGGNRFDIEAVHVHETDKDFPDTKYVRAWDLASTSKERSTDNPNSPHYTAGVKIGVTCPDIVPHIWIPNIVVGQWEAPKRNRKILAATDRDGPAVRIGVESVAGYKDTYTTLNDILDGLRIVEKITVSGDKEVRAAPMEPVFEAHNVHILKASWNELFFQQMGEFPAGGSHDDIVDAAAIGYKMLEDDTLQIIDRRMLGF